MIEDPLGALALIVGAAVVCQLVASRLNVPSMLLLLVTGMALSGTIDPDEIFGELLFTGVGLGVAVLLFEGGTSLTWSKLENGRNAVIRLVSIGALIAWAIGSAAVALALDVPTDLAVLIGAILVVSGPTVVMPLLRVVRPRQPTASILRWEGILIDPVGAGIAIVVLDAVVEERSPGGILLQALATFAAGGAVGAAAAIVVLAALRRRLIADHLDIPTTLAVLIGSYAAADAIRPEAGLIAATVLGLAFANQRRAPAAHIAEFNEALGATVLGVLFVVLGARVDVDSIVDNIGPSLLILAALIAVARPATVIASTIGTDLGWRDRGFLMVLAPRGVVAAAVASLFALELEQHGVDPGPLVPVVFTVVIGTVLLTGIAGRFAANRLRVARPDPNGVALIGGGPFAIALAEVLNRRRVPTIHVGLDDDDAREAAERGQLVFTGRLDGPEFDEAIEAVGVGTALALSGTDHLDGFATERLGRLIGGRRFYGVGETPDPDAPGTVRSIATTPILPAEMTIDRLHDLIARGYDVRAVPAARAIESWHTIARIDESNHIVFDTDTADADPTDTLIQFGSPRDLYRR